jgi:hypothetical protein
MTLHHNLHEPLGCDEPPTHASDRGFGFVFATVFFLISLWPLLSAGTLRWWPLAVSAAFLGTALFVPRALRPLSAAWMRFGLLLHRLVSPVIIGLIFFVTVLPTGIIMRILGKDLLRLRFDPLAQSYWIERRPPGPAPDSLRNQF